MNLKKMSALIVTGGKIMANYKNSLESEKTISMIMQFLKCSGRPSKE